MRALFLCLGLVACGPAPAPTDPASPAAPVRAEAPASPRTDIAGDWVLTEMNGRPAPRSVDPEDFKHPIVASVGDFSFRAHSQCVAFWRRYEIQGERVTMSALNPGPMCARGLSDWEREFDRTLSETTGFSRSADTLTLRGPGTRLVFAAAAPTPTETFIGRWRLRFMHGQAPTGAPIEIEVTKAEIRPDACVFSGWRYRQDGPLVEVTPLSGPVCERMLTPEEQRFGAMMDRLHRATILADGGLILDSPGEQFEFRRID